MQADSVTKKDYRVNFQADYDIYTPYRQAIKEAFPKENVSSINEILFEKIVVEFLNNPSQLKSYVKRQLKKIQG